MKVAVLGAGMIGHAIVKKLIERAVFNEVIVVDQSEEQLNKLQETIESRTLKCRMFSLRDEEALQQVFEEVDVAISCLPAFMSLDITRSAISAKCHLVDLSNAMYVERQQLKASAENSDVLIVTGCGVAPGLVGILAARGIDQLDEAEEATMICGGLPRYPEPPLHYHVLFNIDSLLNLYRRKAEAAIDGETVMLPPLSALEEVTFPEPVGECEMVITGAGSAAYTLKHRCKKVIEKTVRYKGHWSAMVLLQQLGFFSDDEIEVADQKVIPYDVMKQLLAPHFKGNNKEDLTVVKVVVKGKLNDESVTYEWNMIDLYDQTEQMTSMARTTGIPAVIMAEWIAKQRFSERGVMSPEQMIVGSRFDPFMKELERHRIVFKTN